jgi:hypothetical protein
MRARIGYGLAMILATMALNLFTYLQATGNLVHTIAWSGLLLIACLWPGNGRALFTVRLVLLGGTLLTSTGWLPGRMALGDGSALKTVAAMAMAAAVVAMSDVRENTTKGTP